MINKDRLENILSDVRDEFLSAKTKHPGMQNSLHEGYGVLMEEVEEFWDEVKKRQSKRDPAKVYAELVQVAAMAVRTLHDVAKGPILREIPQDYGV